MNNDQRKYLIQQSMRAHDRAKTKIERPSPPSLNNYLVAAVLDDTIQFVDIEKLKANIRQMVLDMGPSDAFIKGRSHRWNRHDDDDDDDIFQLSILAEYIFVFPPAYGEEAFNKLRDENGLHHNSVISRWREIY